MVEWNRDQESDRSRVCMCVRAQARHVRLRDKYGEMGRSEEKKHQEEIYIYYTNELGDKRLQN